jgi:hypothetical protein
VLAVGQRWRRTATRLNVVTMGTSTDPQSAPADCSLSPAGRQARAAEFSAMFAETVRRIERPERTRLRLELEPGPAVASRVAELAAAETSCCSFFTFTLTAAAGSLVLDVAVPSTRLPVLDALAERAAANLSPPG